MFLQIDLFDDIQNYTICTMEICFSLKCWLLFIDGEQCRDRICLIIKCPCNYYRYIYQFIVLIVFIIFCRMNCESDFKLSKVKQEEDSLLFVEVKCEQVR